MFDQLKTVILLGILTGILLGIGYLIGPTALTIAFIIVIALNLITYFFSDKIVLAMYRARPAPKAQFPKLHAMVEEIARKENLPKPKVYIIPTDTANAFATGRSPKHAVVAVTEGILRLLTERELKGVLAHELGHVKNRDILVATVAATIAGIISYIAQMAQFAAIFGGGRDENGGNALGLLVMAILAPIIAVIIQLAISRSREYLADETGAKTLKDADGLANALIKLEQSNRHNPLHFGSKAGASLFIVNPFRGRSFAMLFSTHPDMHSRIQRLKSLKL